MCLKKIAAFRARKLRLKNIAVFEETKLRLEKKLRLKKIALGIKKSHNRVKSQHHAFDEQSTVRIGRSWPLNKIVAVVGNRKGCW